MELEENIEREKNHRPNIKKDLNLNGLPLGMMHIKTLWHRLIHTAGITWWEKAFVAVVGTLLIFGINVSLILRASLGTTVRLSPCDLRITGLNLETASPLAGVRLRTSTLPSPSMVGVLYAGPPFNVSDSLQ